MSMFFAESPNLGSDLGRVTTNSKGQRIQCARANSSGKCTSWGIISGGSNSGASDSSAPFSILSGAGKFDPFQNVVGQAITKAKTVKAATAKKSSSSAAQRKEITLVGVGTLKTYLEPSGFELKVSNELMALGWTVTGTSLKNQINWGDKTQWLRVAAPFLGVISPTWNYSIHISISALAANNAEEIKNRVAKYLAQYFDGLQLGVAGQTFDDGTPQTGGVPPKGSGEKSALGDLWDKLVADFEVSTTTAVVVGGLFLIVMLKKN